MKSLPLIMCLYVLFNQSSADSAPHKTIDLRRSTESSGSNYAVSFCARPSPTSSSLPGHAFVAYSEYSNGSRTYLAVGHTARAPLINTLLSYSKIISSDFSVPGGIAEEVYTSTQEQCLVVRLSAKDYSRLLEKARDAITGELPSFGKKLTVASYKLGAKDCMTFMIDAMKSLPSPGVIVPVRMDGELPLHYIRRVIDKN